MTVLVSHYNRGKLKRVAQNNTMQTRISKNSVMSLKKKPPKITVVLDKQKGREMCLSLMVHYTLFLRQLLKTANTEARSDRSKITKGQHINAVARKILRKYRR